VGTIFVADASAASRQQVLECLSPRNHLVRTFGTLAALGEALAAEVPDLLMLEVRLPDGDAVEWVRSSRKQACIPVIFVTVCSDASERIRAFEAGADDYVVKPFSPQELAMRAEAIIRAYRR